MNEFVLLEELLTWAFTGAIMSLGAMLVVTAIAANGVLDHFARKLLRKEKRDD